MSGSIRTAPGVSEAPSAPHVMTRSLSARPVSGADSRARFAYTYSVLHTKDGRPRRRETPVVFEASREEMNDGPRRRQFVTVPMSSVTSGTYVLRIEVRDLVAGATASSELSFVKE